MTTESVEQIRRLYGQGKSSKEVGDILGWSWRQVISCMQRHGIPRRSRSEATYLKANPAGDPFHIKARLSVDEERLKALGLGLFWGEGFRRNPISVRLYNSDSELLRVFVNFLRIICGVQPDKLRAHIILHSTWLNEYAHVAQSAEHDLGKIGVAGSIPAVGFDGHSSSGPTRR